VQGGGAQGGGWQLGGWHVGTVGQLGTEQPPELHEVSDVPPVSQGDGVDHEDVPQSSCDFLCEDVSQSSCEFLCGDRKSARAIPVPSIPHNPTAAQAAHARCARRLPMSPSKI
jgi:hypothetical protein